MDTFLCSMGEPDVSIFFFALLSLFLKTKRMIIVRV